MTRRLAALHIDRHDYRALFGGDVIEAMSGEVKAAEAEALIEVSEDAIRPTPRGMFYADSVASLLARRRLQVRRHEEAKASLTARADAFDNDNSRGHM